MNSFKWLICISLLVASTPLITRGQTTPAITAIAWKPDGSILAISSTDRIDLVNPLTNQIVSSFSFNESGTHKTLNWNNNGSLLASGFGSGRMIVWNTDNGQILSDRQDTTNGISLITWNEDESFLIAYGVNPSFLKWDANNNYQLLGQDFNQGTMTSIAWHPNRSAVVLGIATGGFHFVDPITFEIGSYALENWINALAWSPNGNRIATGNLAGNIKLWDASNLQFTSTLRLVSEDPSSINFPSTSILAMTFSADSHCLYALQGDGQLLKFDLVTTQLAQTITLTDGPIEIAAFSPDGSKLAYINNSGALIFYDLLAPPSRQN